MTILSFYPSRIEVIGCNTSKKDLCGYSNYQVKFVFNLLHSFDIFSHRVGTTIVLGMYVSTSGFSLGVKFMEREFERDGCVRSKDC